jgi:hypothetical protein
MPVNSLNLSDSVSKIILHTLSVNHTNFNKKVALLVKPVVSDVYLKYNKIVDFWQEIIEYE